MIVRVQRRYAFLHDGILRNYLSKLGEHAKDAAIYWKYGCWFYEQQTRSQALIESNWDNSASETGAGAIRLRAWGQGANNIVTILLQELEKLPIGHPSTITGYIRPGLHAVATSSATIDPGLTRIPDLSEVSETSEPEERGLQQLQITDRPDDLPAKSTPEIFISYAWGDNSSEDARKRGEVVEQLCETLRNEAWNIIRDKNAMRSGDLISFASITRIT
jgi:internalin A